MKREKEINALSGYVMVGAVALTILIGILSVAVLEMPFLLILTVLTLLFLLRGFFMVDPNGSCVMTLFGRSTAER